MNSTDDIPRLERPSFFDGQRLIAHDLTVGQVYNQELRWLHNRSLHGWGIAFGFAVTGSRGDQSVKVDIGYAIDCIGRDLVLDAPIEIPIPAVASASDGGPVTYYLTVSYAEDTQLAPITRKGACKASGAVRRPEMPLIRWQDPKDTDPSSRYRYGLDVVLASVSILNCQLTEASTRERRNAVPPQQPYVAAGRSQAGGTDWRLWPNDTAALGVVTTVTTSEAGFRTTPYYQAHVVGERIFQAADGSETFLVDGYAQLAQMTASSFDLRFMLPVGTTVGLAGAYIFTLEDYQSLFKEAIAKFPNDITIEDAPLINGPNLRPSQMIYGYGSKPLLKLRKDDFKDLLQRISENAHIELDQLLLANGWPELENVKVGLGQPIAIPGSILAINPTKVLERDFKIVDMLKNDLAWHVAWMGVEG
jgi:hypothetical protein